MPTDNAANDQPYTGLDSLENIRVGADAIEQMRSDYEDIRRKHSIALYGHPGAHINNIGNPHDAMVLAMTVLKAVKGAES